MVVGVVRGRRSRGVCGLIGNGRGLGHDSDRSGVLGGENIYEGRLEECVVWRNVRTCGFRTIVGGHTDLCGTFVGRIHLVVVSIVNYRGGGSYRFLFRRQTLRNMISCVIGFSF